MWFKNLHIYRLPSPWNITLTELEEQLSRLRFHPCGSQDRISRGWLPPRPDRHGDGPLVHAVNRQWLLALGTEERLLPTAVVNQEAADRAAELEAQQGYYPGRKQLRDLKEQIEQELLPRAFTRRRTTRLWIDPQQGWLCVDVGSLTKAEETLEALRKCLDQLPVRLLKTQRSPASLMADWLAAGEASHGFTIDLDCELKSVSEERSTVRYTRHPLAGDDIQPEIRAHLAAGKLPSKLALTWDDRLSLILTDALEIRRLVCTDILKEEAEKSADNQDELFDANFTLMTSELVRFLPELLDALGGEIVDDSPSSTGFGSLSSGFAAAIASQRQTPAEPPPSRPELDDAPPWAS